LVLNQDIQGLVLSGWVFYVVTVEVCSFFVIKGVGRVSRGVKLRQERHRRPGVNVGYVGV